MQRKKASGPGLELATLAGAVFGAWKQPVTNCAVERAQSGCMGGHSVDPTCDRCAADALVTPRSSKGHSFPKAGATGVASPIPRLPGPGDCRKSAEKPRPDSSVPRSSELLDRHRIWCLRLNRTAGIVRH